MKKEVMPKINYPLTEESILKKNNQTGSKKEETLQTKKNYKKTFEEEKTSAKEIKYIDSTKKTLSELIGQILPKEFIPSDRIGGILGVVFLGVILLALITFPYGSLLSGDMNAKIDIGYPYPFLELGVSESPILIYNSIIDLTIYLILSYIIDVFLNLVLRNPFPKKGEDTRPTVFKDKKPTAARTIMRKATGK